MHPLRNKFLALVILITPFVTCIILSCATAKDAAADLKTAATPAVANTNGVLVPGPNDSRIAYVTARLLEEYHYSQHTLDEDMAKRFFDSYLEALDPQRVHFLQSDIAEFLPYRMNLDKLTVTMDGKANLDPAFKIYQRFLTRLQQHADYVNELLKQDKFKLNTNERVQLDRRDAPYPKDIAEAKQIWRQRLQYEYLQEKLNLETAKVSNDKDSTNVVKSIPEEIVDTLTRRYARSLHFYANWDSTDVLQAYLDSLTHAYDPHSDYMNLEHAQDFSINMSLSLFGIGAQLKSEDGYCIISQLIPGGPAAKSKQLKEKDKIIAVAQGKAAPVDVVDMELNKVVQLIRGEKGTEVRLTIIPADSPNVRQVVTLIRDEIKLEDQAAKAQIIESVDASGNINRLGVINLPSFYAPIDLTGGANHAAGRSTSEDVAKLIKKLKKENVSGIVIDLRTNPGGSLEEAVKFTGLFITNGPVVIVRSPDGKTDVDGDDDASALYTGPLAVLINRFSASASEIAAAALQDYGRAIVVGDTSTHGKGTVQNLSPLRPFVWPATSTATNDPGTVKITIRKFYRVSGASTQLRGVVPDIILPDMLSYFTTIGESSLDYPLPWDTIPSEKYDQLNLVQPYLAQLTQKSNARVATNQDFAYIKEDIAEFQKSQADKTATLNEREALKEREKTEARKKQREVEQKSRKPSGVKIYEITMRNVSQPGLPPPLGSTNFVSTTTNTTRTATSKSADSDTPESTVTATSADNDDDVIDGKPPIDPWLEETENILRDYIQLSNTDKTLIVSH